MIRRDYIREKTEALSIPKGCSGCAHQSNGSCLLGFGVRPHDYENLNFFNVVTGYHGLRNGNNACHHTDCQPGRACGLALEYMQKPGLTAQLNREILRDENPNLLLQGTHKGKAIHLFQGDASWWVGDALVCPHSFTIRKVAGLCGIEDSLFSGELPPSSTGPWSASVRYLVRDVDDLIVSVPKTVPISSVCFTAHRHGTESVRRQIIKLINNFDDLVVIALCDYQVSNWADWKLDGMIGT